MVNTTTNRFTPIGNDKTIYETEVHYTKFIGIVPKVISVVMPGMFRKQVQLTVDNFKKFVESEK